MGDKGEGEKERRDMELTTVLLSYRNSEGMGSSSEG